MTTTIQKDEPNPANKSCKVKFIIAIPENSEPLTPLKRGGIETMIRQIKKQQENTITGSADLLNILSYFSQQLESLRNELQK